MKQIKELEEMRKRKSKVFYSSNTDGRYKMEELDGNSIENSASSLRALKFVFLATFVTLLFL